MTKTLKLSRKIRRQTGAMVAVVSIVSFMVLLPLGLLGFEVSRLFLAQTQLRNAVDAAALAAVTALRSPDFVYPGQTQAEIDASIKGQGLLFFRRNEVISTELSAAKLSSTVATDNPKEGNSTFNVIVDSVSGKVTAQAAFGLKPAFAEALGLGTVTIRANSVGGFKGIHGDVVLVVDISDSMVLGTGINGPAPVVVNRKFDKNAESGYKLTYVQKKFSRTSPAMGTFGGAATHVIPNPDNVEWDKIEDLKFLKDASRDYKLAVLFEARQGTLDDLALYSKKKVAQGILGDTTLPVTAELNKRIAKVNFKAAYQEAALPFVHPLADAKANAAAFVTKLTAANPDVHVGIVGFAPYAGGNPNKKFKGEKIYTEGKDKFDSYAQSVKQQTIPLVRLDKASSKSTDALKAIETATTFNGTNTTDGLRVAREMLIGPGHRNGVNQTIILLTDGIPTVGGYKQVARQCGASGLNIQCIGFFHTGYAKRGIKSCNKIAKSCGNGSAVFEATFEPLPGSTKKKDKNKGSYSANAINELSIAFNLIARGEPALVN